MERDEWRRARALLEAALERDPAERHQFLKHACGGDSQLHAEVASLLEHDQADSFLETPAASVTPALGPTLAVGTRLGPYEILASLGRGGMGEVYRARDTRLDRTVAIKLLPSRVAADPAVRQRFEREARAVAALNHPHICTLHDVGRHDELDFLVLEYLEGETLADRVTRGPLPLDQVLRYATEIAEALATAHRQAIVHRDLKPANIMITTSGVKLLDFGLAKLPRPEPIVTGAGAPPSRESPLTGERTILGTLQYMAPEQLEGKGSDARTDIFAFGAVLYEMATGRRAFEGKSEASLIAAILEREPQAPSSLRPVIPAALDQLVKRCLTKDPDERWPSADDLLVELKEIAEGQTSPVFSLLRIAGKRLLRPGWKTALAIGVALAVATGYLAWQSFEQRGTEQPAPVHRQITFTGTARDPALSPDGNLVAYVQDEGSDQKLMVQDVAGGQAIQVFRGEFCGGPKWSPDGTQLAVAARDESGAFRIFIVRRFGGQARPLASGALAAWSPDGKRLATAFESSKGFTVVDGVSEHARSVRLGDFRGLFDLDWSRASDRIVLLTTEEPSPRYALWSARPDGAEARKFYETGSVLRAPRWSASGDSVYVLQRAGTSFDLLEISAVGNRKPRIVLTGLQAGVGLGVGTNKLLYARSPNYANLWRLGPSGIATGGRLDLTPITLGTALRSSPTISPDGTRVAYAEGQGDTSNIHVSSLVNGQSRQVTFFNARSSSPAWSPDGRRMAFASNQGGTIRVWLLDPESGSPRPLERTQLVEFGLIWAPGGDILYRMPDVRNYMRLDPDTGEQRPLVNPMPKGWRLVGRYAPDGQRIAFSRNVGGGTVMLTVFSIADASETVVANGLLDPIGWSPDSRWIYASNRVQGTLVRVPARGGEPQLLLKPSSGKVVGGSVSPDGRTIICSIAETTSDIWLVENLIK